MATFKTRSGHLSPLILTNPIVYRAAVTNSILFYEVGIKGVKAILFGRGIVQRGGEGHTSRLRHWVMR